MPRLLVHVEGQTEESFVNEVLAPNLFARGFVSVSARIVGNARLRQHRGGIKPWIDVKRDIVRHLKEDGACISTTMVDYYALPQGANSAWPGRIDANALAFPYKGSAVETGMLADVCNDLDVSPDRCRFVPFILMHEFEALLFSDCMAFAEGIGQAGLAPGLQAIRNAFETPEHINDSPMTAPSKRVEALFPGYEKPLYGTLAALEIGIDKIRGACPRFDDWMARLEDACPANVAN